MLRIQRLASRSILVLPALLPAACGGGGGGSTPPPTPPTPTVVFAAPAMVPTGGVDGRNLAFADIDRDGLLDAIVDNPALGSVSLLRGQATGTFAAGLATAAMNLVAATTLADVTGDRIVDLVAASGATATATVQPGFGSGAFGAAAALPVTWGVGKLAVVDWNKDGIADVVASSTATGEVALLRGTGAGAFAAAVVTATPYIVADFAIADFDGDQRPDLACVGNGFPSIDVLRNDGAGGMLAAVTTATAVRGPRLCAADLDGDRLVDLVTLDSGLTSATVGRGQGNGTFVQLGTIGLATTVVDGIAAGDLDGDGDVDLVASATDRIAAAFGDGLGGFLGAEVLRVESGPVRSVALADTRGIGVLDVVYVLAGNLVVVLQNPRTNVTGLEVFGTGSPECRGRIGLYAAGLPRVGNAGFGYVTTNAPVSAAGMLLQGGPPDLVGSDPFGGGFLLHFQLGGLIVSRIVFSDGHGTNFTADPIPATPQLAGLPVYAQTLWLGDAATSCAASPQAVSSSRGLTVTIQP
jgi:hypothetical protein